MSDNTNKTKELDKEAILKKLNNFADEIGYDYTYKENGWSRDDLFKAFMKEADKFREDSWDGNGISTLFSLSYTDSKGNAPDENKMIEVYDDPNVKRPVSSIEKEQLLYIMTHILCKGINPKTSKIFYTKETNDKYHFSDYLKKVGGGKIGQEVSPDQYITLCKLSDEMFIDGKVNPETLRESGKLAIKVLGKKWWDKFCEEQNHYDWKDPDEGADWIIQKSFENEAEPTADKFDIPLYDRVRFPGMAHGLLDKDELKSKGVSEEEAQKVLDYLAKYQGTTKEDIENSYNKNQYFNSKGLPDRYGKYSDKDIANLMTKKYREEHPNVTDDDLSQYISSLTRRYNEYESDSNLRDLIDLLYDDEENKHDLEDYSKSPEEYYKDNPEALDTYNKYFDIVYPDFSKARARKKYKESLKTMSIEDLNSKKADLQNIINMKAPKGLPKEERERVQKDIREQKKDARDEMKLIENALKNREPEEEEEAKPEMSKAEPKVEESKTIEFEPEKPEAEKPEADAPEIEEPEIEEAKVEEPEIEEKKEVGIKPLDLDKAMNAYKDKPKAEEPKEETKAEGVKPDQQAMDKDDPTPEKDTIQEDHEEAVEAFDKLNSNTPDPDPTDGHSVKPKSNNDNNDNSNKEEASNTDKEENLPIAKPSVSKEKVNKEPLLPAVKNDSLPPANIAKTDTNNNVKAESPTGIIPPKVEEPKAEPVKEEEPEKVAKEKTKHSFEIPLKQGPSMLTQTAEVTNFNDDTPSKSEVLVSDERLKEIFKKDITPLTKIHAYDFKYKPEAQKAMGLDGDMHSGVIAQEVEANPNYKGCVTELPNGSLALKPKELSAANTGAIGNLARSIEEITKEIENIKRMIGDYK